MFRELQRRIKCSKHSSANQMSLWRQTGEGRGGGIERPVLEKLLRPIPSEPAYNRKGTILRKDVFTICDARYNINCIGGAIHVTRILREKYPMSSWGELAADSVAALALYGCGCDHKYSFCHRWPILLFLFTFRLLLKQVATSFISFNYICALNLIFTHPLRERERRLLRRARNL